MDRMHTQISETMTNSCWLLLGCFSDAAVVPTQMRTVIPRPIMAKFHYADFLRNFPVREFGPKGRHGFVAACRGRHGEVGIVEFGLYGALSVAAHLSVRVSYSAFGNRAMGSY